MKDMLTVLKYTIKENISKKSFIITTAILVLLIIIICNVPNIINLFESYIFLLNIVWKIFLDLNIIYYKY